MKTGDWLLLIGGCLLVLCLSLVTPVRAAENSDCNECNSTVWELRFNGHKVNAGDLETEEECEALRDTIDPQTPGFTELECVEVWVVRYES